MGSHSRRTIPPPVYFTASFLAGAGLHRLFPLALPTAGWLQALGWVLLTAAALVAVAAIATLLHARTPVHPGAEAKALVTSGPFAYTRNPMYLALVVSYAGLALSLNLGWPLLFLPPLTWVVHRFVIRAEEQSLTRIFGTAYTTYSQHVRRWI